MLYIYATYCSHSAAAQDSRLLGCYMEPSDKQLTMLQTNYDATNYLSVNTAKHPKRIESSVEMFILYTVHW